MPETVVELKRELGLRDITLFTIACITGVRWIPAAAHAGAGSVTLWLLAAVLFLVPLAISVAALCVKYPGAGGFYLWTRNDFGPWHGFLCFWIYWIGIAFWFPTAAMFYMSAGAYTLGPAFAHLAENPLYLVTISLIAIWIALGSNLIGMRIGKWTENLGGTATWIIAVIFLLLAGIMWMKRGPATPLHIIPKWNWDTANFWSTIAYGLTGVEMAGLMSAEIRDPARTLPRAGWIASGFAAAFYSSLTVALLILLRPEKIDEINGFAQSGEVAASALGLHWLPPVVAILVFITGLGQFGGMGTAVSRLPFAVGVDKLLPRAFAKIHPRWGTPYVSIIVLGVVASVLLVAFQLGDTMRAAYSALVSLMVIGGFLPYIYIFGSAWKAGKQISAVSGWAVTALALICSVAPTAEVKNVWLFEFKLAAGTLAMIASAWVLYRNSERKLIS
jgi:amino acid transporter